MAWYLLFASPLTQDIQTVSTFSCIWWIETHLSNLFLSTSSSSSPLLLCDPCSLKIHRCFYMLQLKTASSQCVLETGRRELVTDWQIWSGKHLCNEWPFWAQLRRELTIQPLNFLCPATQGSAWNRIITKVETPSNDNICGAATLSPPSGLSEPCRPSMDPSMDRKAHHSPPLEDAWTSQYLMMN